MCSSQIQGSPRYSLNKDTDRSRRYSTASSSEMAHNAGCLFAEFSVPSACLLSARFRDTREEAKKTILGNETRAGLIGTGPSATEKAGAAGKQGNEETWKRGNVAR